MLITIVIAILVGIIGFKIIENYPYFFSILKKFWSLMLPVVYGLVFGYILNPLVKLIKRRFKVKEGVAILSTYLLVLALLILASIYLIPIMIDSAVDITTKMPIYIQETQDWLDIILNNESVKEIINTTGTMDNVNHIITQFGTMAVTLLEGSISYIFTISSQIVKLFLGLLISIYVLVDRDRLIKESKKVTFLILKEKKGKKLIEGVRIYNNMIGAYIGIKAIDSAIIAAMALVLLTIVKSEYAFLLAVIVGITNMIPYFGPFIGEIVGFLFNVFVSPTKGVIVFLVLLALQLFDGWYLDPKLIGDKVGVRPLFIIIAVLIGGGFYGAFGMLLASPTAATIKVYYERIMKKNEDLVKIAEKS
ncbi:AI-2E family transporter [Clostridium tertium]|uniref:AI-2E family transporter n=3 Tax=Clostridium TaxID=1485 RepID=UPI00232E4255|nr:AI-2E family transporter [Clostridium tertium]MDB1923637.1 AI-2E family transporter [Clostridium tertium]MDB1926049.1 AI-2E family transporter [Clostridium tertium]MDB1929161.1 AI-2E family transporter [Clostridium tertium]